MRALWLSAWTACALSAAAVVPATVLAAPSTPAAHADAPAVTQHLATGVFNGTNFQGLSGSGTNSPSDSTGDASPTQQVEMVNSSFNVYPNGCPACGGSGGPLYNLVGAGLTDCVFDPQVAYDQSWGHWIFVMGVQRSSSSSGCTGDQNTNIIDDRLVLGWTYTSDATDFLHFNVCWLNLDQGANLDDFPKLGHDDSEIVVGANVFSNYGQGPFQNSMVWTISKPSGVSPTNGCGIGGPKIVRTSLGSSVFTPVPAVMTDGSGVDYIVAAQRTLGGTANTLFVWQSSLSAGVLYVGSFLVADYSLPPAVPQPLTATSPCAIAGNCLDSGDTRLTGAVGRYDPDAGQEAIWTQHTITDSRVSSRSVVRWYEILPAAASVRQSGDVSDSSLYLFNGAVSPAVAGNEAVIAYDAAGAASNGFVSVRAQSRNSLTPLGTMSNETVLASSSVNDTDFTCGINKSPADGTPCRWGDYAAARPDPSNANGVWTFEMLVGSATSWTTQVAEVTPGCTAVQLYVTAQSGASVQFTAAGPGGGPTQGFTPPAGCPGPRFQFWLQSPGGAWSVAQPWSSSNIFNWDTTGYRPGPYKIDVWANQAGDSTANAESFALMQWTIPYCTNASASANQMSPGPAGVHVTITASATCPNPSPQFQFWLLPPGGPWTIAQPFSTSNTFSWDSTGLPAGNYHFSVWAKDATSSGAFGAPPYTYDAFAGLDFVLQSAPPCTGMSTSVNPAAATIGTPVTVTGAATGCPGPRYQFWLLPPGGGWTIVQPYSATSTYAWDTSGWSPGTYRFSVWARDASSSASYEAFSAFDYTLTVGPPCSTMSASAAPPTTTTVGTSVTVTGSAMGCSNPRFEFWLKSPSGSWALVQPYSTSATFVWSNAGAAAGTYRFSVWARDGSSAAAYDTYNAFDYTLTVAPCTGMSANASPMNTAPRGTPVVITGTATGCPHPQYEVWALLPGGTWTLLTTYNGSASYSWSTAGLPAGSYRISVWARDASSGGTNGTAPYTYDAFSAFQYTLT